METPDGNYWRTKKNILSLVCFFALDQITKIKIYYMVVIENTKVIEGRQGLIYMDVIEPAGEAEDGSVDDDGVASDE